MRWVSGKLSWMASSIASSRRYDRVIASPSARKMRRTGKPPVASVCSSCRIDCISLGRNFFCGSVYISQKVHLFQEQPLVTCRISELASLGGRYTGSMYSGNKGSLSSMLSIVLSPYYHRFNSIVYSLSCRNSINIF